MADMGTEPDPESKIWKLTGAGFGFLVFGSDFGVNFSDSAHFCQLASHMLWRKSANIMKG